jgi:hypothetical protein
MIWQLLRATIILKCPLCIKNFRSSFPSGEREQSVGLLRLSGTRDEFPNQDVTLRVALSPLTAFSKTHGRTRQYCPKAIGVKAWCSTSTTSTRGASSEASMMWLRAASMSWVSRSTWRVPSLKGSVPTAIRNSLWLKRKSWFSWNEAPK